MARKGRDNKDLLKTDGLIRSLRGAPLFMPVKISEAKIGGVG